MTTIGEKLAAYVGILRLPELGRLSGPLQIDFSLGVQQRTLSTYSTSSSKW